MKKHSYVIPFETSEDWESIEILFSELYPTYRGKKLIQPYFDSKHLEMIAFLIGNKTPESFKLTIDSITLT